MLNAINFGARIPRVPNNMNNYTRDYLLRSQDSLTDVVELSGGVTNAIPTDRVALKAEKTLQKADRLISKLEQDVPILNQKALLIGEEVETRFKKGVTEGRFNGVGDETLKEFENGELVRQSEFYDGNLRTVKLYNYNDAQVYDMFVYFNAQKPSHLVKGFYESFDERQYDSLTSIADGKVGVYEQDAKTGKHGIYKGVELVAQRGHLSEYREDSLLSHGEFTANNVLCFNNNQPSGYLEKIINDGQESHHNNGLSYHDGEWTE